MNQWAVVLILLMAAIACQQPGTEEQVRSDKRIPVIFDTDANNELDDQHALAYLLLNQATFDVRGITVNSTFNGSTIQQQYDEARRVMDLCAAPGTIPLLMGADSGFLKIRTQLDEPDYDGHDAVEFIINETRKTDSMVVIAVGKLTNIALAIQKAPELASRFRLVWLGSNYPEPGEYNQVNDTAALSFLLQTGLPFEMVTVRYGKPSGTDAVKVTREEIKQYLGGKGPQVATPVTGRHGGSFHTFGDYSVDLFEHAQMYGDPPSRALFDLAAVAIVKNPSWAHLHFIPAPRLVDGNWVDQPENPRQIGVWEDFSRDSIIQDLFRPFQ